ncbi:hypothetical protein [Streptomyces roseochromogenus]|uniref:Uncharacterized protein n=1 Tax=Streptomyces roseochromogenus subsp. oscitans DS 12.976 TaxID=1352936 RepID=V6KHS4_STRRC|nr:hypothetical protein [Streptomyces roseochromogenus]EST31593.1 hypothetical protein M878_16295 [Streptomyces roseochromogenus subsp. oscitans DS 12.976]
MRTPRYRSIGVDPATGKEAFVVARPGGLLEALADAQALETAAVLVAVVGAVLEAGEASDLELAALVPPLHAALDECVGMIVADRE